MENNPKSQILKSLQKVTGLLEINLEVPDRGEFGDYMTNIAMRLYSQMSGKGKGKQKNVVSNHFPNQQFNNPYQLAEYLVDLLSKDKELMNVVKHVNVAGPGFINFHLHNESLLNILIKIIEEKNVHGMFKIDNKRKIVVEYAHPNTHKPFHIGHLRNITTGEALARILAYSGSDVKRVNYQGDVGLHVAKAIWGISKLGFKDPNNVKSRAEYLGKAYVEGNKACEENETVKEEIYKINEALYKGMDRKLLNIYKKTRQWSLDYFKHIYQRVDTNFDRLYFESEVAENGIKIARESKDKGILQESEGAVIFPGSKYGLHDRVFITSRGVPTYESKDLGLAKLQFKEFDPDLLIHVVGPEQTDYFKVLFKALEFILPETKSKEVHIPYGWVRLKSGKMASRTGNVVLGEWLLDEVKKRIIEIYKSDHITAEGIAVGAVKYSFLKSSLDQEIAFDIHESISIEGNSGPYLQYTYARIQSVLSKSKISLQKLTDMSSGISNIDLNPEELSILKILIHFSEAVQSAAFSYSPNILCNYLYNLAQKFNTFYNAHKILVDDSTTLKLRLELVFATGIVLKNGLNLLGIRAPTRM